MAIKFNRSQTFATNGTVTSAGLHNLVDGLDVYQALITDQTALTNVKQTDKLLIADSNLTASDAPRSVVVSELFQDGLSTGTYTNVNAQSLFYTNGTGNYTLSTGATITTGTIPNLTAGTTTSTLGTITNLTAGTTNSTGASITNGTIQTLTASTATISQGSAILTQGTIVTLNSTTGTIGNLSTTLAGDFTISQGTGTLGTSGVTSGTYGNASAIPFITVDAKGRITSATTGTFSSTPPDASITPAKMSGAQSGSAPAYAIRGWVNFNGTGTISIRGSGNVSSISDGGVGIYTVNWNTPMPSATYSVSYSINDTNSGPYCIPYVISTNSGTFSTSAIGIENHTSTDPNARGDSAYSFVIAIV